MEWFRRVRSSTPEEGDDEIIASNVVIIADAFDTRTCPELGRGGGELPAQGESVAESIACGHGAGGGTLPHTRLILQRRITDGGNLSGSADHGTPRFNHRRSVAKDDTVRFQLHTLQLLPRPERSSYAGAAVEVLDGLDGRLTVRHEGHIIAAQEAPPSPVLLRTATGVPNCSCPAIRCQRPGRTLDGDSRTAGLKGGHGMINDGVVRADKPAATSARKPTFLQSRIVQVGGVSTKSVSCDAPDSRRLGLLFWPGSRCSTRLARDDSATADVMARAVLYVASCRAR